MKKIHFPICKTAIVQMPPVFLNLQESVARAVSYIREAADNGANLIVFPETWLPGYPMWLDYAPNAAVWQDKNAEALFRILFENSLQWNSEEFLSLKNTATETNTTVVMGANERIENTIYNSIIYFPKDAEPVVHRKLTPTYTERLIWGMGDGSTLSCIDTDFGRIGGLICWEHWVPLARVAMHAKTEQIHIAQWPFVKELHQNACRNYAFEGQCFVIAAGGMLSKKEALEGVESLGNTETHKRALSMIESIPVNNDELILKGGSSIIKPDHYYLMEPVYTTSSILYCSIDTSLIPEGLLYMDSNGHYSRPDIFSLTIDTEPKSNVKFSNESP